VWAWVAFTALFFVLRAGGAIRSVPLCVFLSAIAGALFFSLDQLRAVGPAHPLLRSRQVVLVVVLVAIPSLFDPSTAEIDNLPRLVVLVVTAVLVVGIWAVDATWNGWRPRRLVNGFHGVLLAIVVWFGVTSLTSVAPRQSFVGRYGTYEGFILLAALAVLSSALAESFTFEALPTLFRMVVASTVPVLVYGAIQLYGFDVQKGSDVDFVPWHNAFHNVFASLGNPNHLGGFLVTVLPLGVATALLARHRWVRVGLWVWVGLALLLLLQTAARGAWLGGIAGGAVLVVGLLPRIRVSARRVVLAAGASVVVAVVLVTAGSRFLGAKATALLRVGAGSSVSQRYGYWSAALRLAGHHPIVGTGPDTFADTYSRYQDAALAKTLGTTYFVNGAHNIFLSWLANEGIPGLLLILALFVFGLAWGVRAWMVLRTDRAAAPAGAASGAASSDGGDTGSQENRRLVVVALVAGLVAFFVQACFDVEQVGTLFILFVVLGLLGSLNRGLWPRAALAASLPFRHVAVGPEEPPAEDDPDYDLAATVHARAALRGQGDLRRLTATLVAGALAVAALGLTFWRTDALWRADHQEWVGTQNAMEQATRLNPWEPSYFESLGQSAGTTYLHDPKAPDALGLVQAAVGFLRQGAALDPDDTTAEANYGGGLETLATLEHSPAVARMSLAALRRARQDDPFNTQVAGLIRSDQHLLGKA
jgi:O-antigen ligase